MSTSGKPMFWLQVSGGAYLLGCISLVVAGFIHSTLLGLVACGVAALATAGVCLCYAAASAKAEEAVEALTNQEESR